MCHLLNHIRTKPTSSSFLIAAFVISQHFPLSLCSLLRPQPQVLMKRGEEKISMGCEPTSTHLEDHIIGDILGESTLHKHTELFGASSEEKSKHHIDVIMSNGMQFEDSHIFY